MHRCALEAAQQHAAHGISVDAIDPRTLVPLELPTMGASVDRTNDPMVGHEASTLGSWGATLTAKLMTRRVPLCPPPLISGDNTPVPYLSVLVHAVCAGPAIESSFGRRPRGPRLVSGGTGLSELPWDPRRLRDNPYQLGIAKCLRDPGTGQRQRADPRQVPAVGEPRHKLRPLRTTRKPHTGRRLSSVRAAVRVS